MNQCMPPALSYACCRFDNCDGIQANGCEANLNTDVAHCGTCRTAAVALNNSQPACVGGQPALGTCLEGWVCNAGLTACVVSLPTTRVLVACSTGKLACSTGNCSTSLVCSVTCAPGYVAARVFTRDALVSIGRHVLASRCPASQTCTSVCALALSPVGVGEHTCCKLPSTQVLLCMMFMHRFYNCDGNPSNGCETQGPAHTTSILCNSSGITAVTCVTGYVEQGSLSPTNALAALLVSACLHIPSACDRWT
jgi:hypothetical protein